MNQYVKTYVNLLEQITCAQAELDALTFEYNSLHPDRDARERKLINESINAQRQLIQKLNNNIEKWGNDLKAIGEKYGEDEYALFKMLIIDGIPPSRVPYSLSAAYRYLTKFNKDIAEYQKSRES